MQGEGSSLDMSSVMYLLIPAMIVMLMLEYRFCNVTDVMPLL